MSIAIMVLHVVACLFLILVVLLQAGKGGGMGLAFGGSGAQQIFGGSGAGNLLTKLTAATAGTFMLTSLLLAYFASSSQSEGLKKYWEETKAQAKVEEEQRKKLAATSDAGAASTGTAPATQPTQSGAPATQPAGEGSLTEVPEAIPPAPATQPSAPTP